VQSGPGLRGVEAKDATAFAERLLAHLNIRPDELERLQLLPHAQLTEALATMPPSGGQGAMGVAMRGNAMRLAPVMDGDYLPRHPPRSDIYRAGLIPAIYTTAAIPIAPLQPNFQPRPNAVPIQRID